MRVSPKKGLGQTDHGYEDRPPRAEEIGPAEFRPSPLLGLPRIIVNARSLSFCLGFTQPRTACATLLPSYPRSRPYFFSAYGKWDADALWLHAKVNGRFLGHLSISYLLLLLFLFRGCFIQQLLRQFSCFCPDFPLFQTTFATKPFPPSQLERRRWPLNSDGNCDGHLNVSFLWLKWHCDKSSTSVIDSLQCKGYSICVRHQTLNGD